MSAQSIPSSFRAVVASPDLGTPTIQSIVLDDLQKGYALAEHRVLVKNHAVALNP
jgi:hypothetical protein